MKRSLALAALCGAAVLTTTGCTVTSNQPDQTAVLYADGMFHDTDFKDCIDPAVRDYSSFFSKSYQYPSGQRTFTFNGPRDAPEEVSEARDAEQLDAVTSNNVQMFIDGSITFRLNTDCETLRQFHEDIGLKNSWSETLRIYILQPLRDAIATETKKYTWQELYSDAAKRQQWAENVKAALPQRVADIARGAYFDEFNVVIQQPRIPQDLLDALRQAEVAIQQNNAQQQRNVQVDSEIVSIQKLVAVLGVDGYVTYQAIKDGKIQVIPVPQGGAINVTPR